jgi:hypothetical protein
MKQSNWLRRYLKKATSVRYHLQHYIHRYQIREELSYYLLLLLHFQLDFVCCLIKVKFLTPRSSEPDIRPEIQKG